jgi:protein-tyrosine phosphatase
MQHVFWLEADRIAGRAGPTAEEWSADELVAAGIGAILNLSEHEPTPECATAGIEVTWIPMPVTCPPEAEDEAECLRALPVAYDFLVRQLAQGRPVLVHCVRGCDRTGLVLAYHVAVTQGMGAEEAITFVRRVRPEAITAPGWEEMAQRVITKLSAR